MKNFAIPQTVTLISNDKASKAADRFILKNREGVYKHGEIPIWAGVSAKLMRYVRSQRRRIERGQRCNLTKGYIK